MPLFTLPSTDIFEKGKSKPFASAYYCGCSRYFSLEENKRIYTAEIKFVTPLYQQHVLWYTIWEAVTANFSLGSQRLDVGERKFAVLTLEERLSHEVTSPTGYFRSRIEKVERKIELGRFLEWDYRVRNEECKCGCPREGHWFDEHECRYCRNCTEFREWNL